MSHSGASETALGGRLNPYGSVVGTGTRPNEDGDGIVAHVEPRTLDGRVVGAAEGECSRAERRWRDCDPFAIRSMAQTRAISRALRAPLGQIVVLAGYDTAGAEETPADTASEYVGDDDRQPKVPNEARPSREQIDAICRLIRELHDLDPDTDWRATAREIVGVPYDQLTAAAATGLIRELQQLRETKGAYA